ncbi:hypothetical protein [Ructibacterium gallinarum]|uniref:Alpha-L-arabinofuranosidase n=1 Tax=Ructibacterium gallinarum TaxID=2779355 RepID=A0A9D5M234_9FIRM|nr:hypothetical protein [Ructibacterium gallinarum]MBE5040716.1 hypothetical protein [Ructibacterium gallinarum]
MKKGICGILSAMALTACLCISVNAAETQTAILSVNENDIIKPSDRAFLGINDGWQNVLAVKQDSAEISEEFVDAFRQTGTPIAVSRLAGTESQSFYWKDSIGTADERGYYGSQTNGAKVSHGIIEWLEYTRAVDKAAKFDFVINLNDSPENNADLIRFLCLDPSDPKAVGSDGTNWAQKRVDLGWREKIVPIIELGNEYDLAADYTDADAIAARAKEYITLCEKHMAVMQAVKPDLQFAALMFTVPHAANAKPRIWNEKIIDALGRKCDYVSFHYYYGSSSDELERYRMPEITDYLDEIEASDRPKILFTEHAKWTANDRDAVDRLETSALKGVLISGQIINLTTTDSYTAGMIYHGMGNGGVQSDDDPILWHVVSRHADDGKLYISGIGALLKLYNYAYGSGKSGENVVRATLSGNACAEGGDSSGARLTVSAHTTPDGGLNLVFVNNEKTTAAQQISFSAQNEYRLEREYILTADDLMADNKPNTPEALYPVCNLINSQTAFTSYTISPASAVVLKLVPMSAQTVEQAAELVVENSEVLNGKIIVAPTDRIVSFSGQLFANKEAADAESLTLTVRDTSNTIVYTDTQRVCWDHVYFDAEMPNNVNGTYIAVLSGGGTSNIVEFEYRPQMVSGYVRSIVPDGAYANGVKQVNNADYSFDCKITFDSEFAAGVEYIITVVEKESNNIVAMETQTRGSESFDTVHIKMPKDAIEGRYVISVSCPGDRAEGIAEFDFYKPDEIILLGDWLYNENGEMVTLENIADIKSLYIKVINRTDAIMQLLFMAAAYDGESLVHAETAIHTLAARAEGTVPMPISITAESIDAIRVYVWEKGCLKPLSEVYDIT